MEFDLVVAGGNVVDETRIRRLDVGISKGRVAALSAEPLRGRETVDARGRMVFPGGVDTHAHLREPGREDKEDFGTGTAAAIRGGVTSVLDIQNNEPFTTDRSRAEEKLALVGPKSRTRFAIYGSVGAQNIDRLMDVAPFVAAFKVFMTQSVGSLTVTGLGELSDVFRRVKETGRVLAVHAESDAIHLRAKLGLPDAFASHVLARPPLAEAAAVAECIELCREFRTPLNLPHLSTARSVELVRRAKEDGLPISAATCPHYLIFDADEVATRGAVLKVNPSIKYASDREALIEGVRSGVIDHVHSDHAPHTPEEKSKNYGGAPSGIAGLQHHFPVLMELVAAGRISAPVVARALCAAPARAFGVKDVGSLEVGMFADVCIVDPATPCVPRAEDLVSKARTSPYVGRSLRGSVVGVVLGGRIVLGADGRVDDAVRGERLSVGL